MNSETEKNVILCRGKKTDGTQCKAEIQKNFKFCGKCGAKVDPQLFSSNMITCQSQRDDGSICENILEDDHAFYTMCSAPQPESVAKTDLKIYSADTCVRKEGSPMVLDCAASLNSSKHSTQVALSSEHIMETVGKKDEMQATEEEMPKIAETIKLRNQRQVIESQEKANTVDKEKEAGVEEQLKSKITGVEETNTMKEVKSFERKEEEWKQTESNERGKRTREHDMTKTKRIRAAEVTTLPREQPKKVTEEIKRLEHIGQTKTKKVAVYTIKDEKDEMKRKEDINQVIQSEREDSQEKTTSNSTMNNEAFQGGMQEENSNDRRKILTNQDTNNGNTSLQRQITNLWDPNSIILHFHVLVSPDFKWKMWQHKVFIDIYWKSLKSWDSYKMEHVRQVQDYEEMHIHMVVKKVVFQSGFDYIYAICNQQKDEKKLEKYCIHGWDVSRLTRMKYRSCLLSARMVDTNEYHQYDGVMNRNLKGDYNKRLEKHAKISAKLFTQEKLLSTGYMVHKLDQETLNMLEMLLLGLEKMYLQDAKCWSSSQEGFKEKQGSRRKFMLMKNPILEQMNPKHNICDLWKIVQNSHKDQIPNIFKVTKLAMYMHLQKEAQNNTGTKKRS